MALVCVLFSYQIGKRLVDLKFISLVNLILDREVVTELIQGNFNVNRLEKELNSILDNKKREQLFNDYYVLKKFEAANIVIILIEITSVNF